MAKTRDVLSRTLGVLLAGTLGSACTPAAKSATPPTQPTSLSPSETTPLPASFQAVTPQVYVGKIKNILTGQAPTDAEVQAVVQSPTALSGMIDTWMQTPAFQTTMINFFRNAFQQAQVDTTSLMDQIGVENSVDPLLLQNFMDSFALTAWQLAFVEKQPFTQTLTTTRFMVTPPMASFMAGIDYRHFDDAGKFVDLIMQEDKTFNVTLSHTAGMIPLSQSVDRISPNYLHFYLQNPVPAATCTDPITYIEPMSLFLFLFGSVTNTPTCTLGFSVPEVWSASDYASWRMVNIRQPVLGEDATRFYDMDTLRTGSELVFRIPRVGFFSTPAFFANWNTNASNQARVTMNQTLIVSLGRSFDDHNNVVPMSEPALDAAHASQPACLTCHKSLDPMRQVFRQTYTFSYHTQLDPTETGLAGIFAFDGVTKPLASVAELGAALAAHPDFAGAWTQKLCQWANSADCEITDPEFLRVAQVFQSSNFNFPTLLKTLLMSPLITGAANTVTFADQGLTISVARRDQLCAAMSTRLGVPSICNQGGAPGLALIIPSDGYSRGSTEPVMATDPTLFYTAGTEQLCNTFAGMVVDATVSGQPGRYSSKNPNAAIADMVSTVMGVVPSDPRWPTLQQVLAGHFKTVSAVAGITPTSALRDTFVLACSSPTSVSIGL